MDAMKLKFEKWLQKQGLAEKTKSGKLGTIATYIDAINGICKERFPKDFNRYNPDKSWQLLSEEVVSVAAKYQELSHKDYMLDNVIVWYAIDYFEKVLKFIYKKNWDEKSEVNLYLFHDDTDHFIKSIQLQDLGEYTQYFATLYFNRKFRPKKINPDRFDEFKEIVDKIIWGNHIKEVQNVGFHIVYKQSGVNNKKSAINHFYNCFVEPAAKSPLALQAVMPLLQVSFETEYKAFKITQAITGEQPLQIGPNEYAPNNKDDKILRKDDLVVIFGLNPKTVQNSLLKSTSFSCKKNGNTFYYSWTQVNEYLKAHHHSAVKKYKDVNYKLSGQSNAYDYWVDKNTARQDYLGIGKNAFYTYVNPRKKSEEKNKRGYNKNKIDPEKINCPYIDYVEGHFKYYVPALEHLKTLDSIRNIASRKKYTRKT